MRMIDADALLRAYDEAHEGPPGKARKLIEDAPTVSGLVSRDAVLEEIDDTVTAVSCYLTVAEAMAATDVKRRIKEKIMKLPEGGDAACD